jgi:hypothetical protein
MDGTTDLYSQTKEPWQEVTGLGNKLMSPLDRLEKLYSQTIPVIFLVTMVYQSVLRLLKEYDCGNNSICILSSSLIQWLRLAFQSPPGHSLVSLIASYLFPPTHLADFDGLWLPPYCGFLLHYG